MKNLLDDRPIVVAIIEDDDAIRRSLSMIVDGAPGYVCTQAYGRAEDAIGELPANPPDVILMDVGLPGMSGIDATRILREQIPDVDVVMLTVQEDDDTVFNSLCAGATGYLVKTTSPATILQSIDEVHRGGSPMSASIARRVTRSFQTAAEVPSSLTNRERDSGSSLRWRKLSRDFRETLHQWAHRAGTYQEHLRKAPG